MPTREEIAAIRRSGSKPPVNFPVQGQPSQEEQKPAPEAPVSPATPSPFPIPPIATQGTPEGQELELPPGASPKASEAWNQLKEKHKSELTAIKTELEEARQKLNDAIKTGTQGEQAIAREEYEALKQEKAEFQTKLSDYEAQIKLEREAREKYENELKQTKSSLSKLSLDFDPEFQERYVKPLENLQTKLGKKIKALSENKEVADQVNSILYRAVQQGDDEAFYSTLRQIKEVDPDNYGMYTGDAQAMRDLLIERLGAMENHEKTAQTLRQESYKTRERTVPEARRKLLEVRQKIDTQDPQLSTHLSSPEYTKFLKSVGIDPGQIETQLEQAVSESHKTGELSEQLLYFAAEGARKLQLTPSMMFMKDQYEKSQKEIEELREQLNSLRGSSGVRPTNGSGNGQFQPLQPAPRHTPSDIRRMSGSERKANMASAFAGNT